MITRTGREYGGQSSSGPVNPPDLASARAFGISEDRLLVMALNGTEFEWSGKAERAAMLVAADDRPDHAIAKACKISKRTLERWKTVSAFAERVEANRRLLRQQVEAEGIANRKNRVAAQNDRWRRMQRVIDERAADAANEKVPGWTTGLLVHRRKQIGGGESAQVVDEYEVDTGLLKELREHEKLTAEELGQRRQVVDLEVNKELEQALDRLAAGLGPEEYARVLAALASPEDR